MYKDWRISNQFNYLYKSELKKKNFIETATRDHTHCSFCWEKFGEADNLLHQGYCTNDECHWICASCFRDFNEIFGWIVDE